MTYTFANPKKSAHYESNTPAHGMVLAGVPVNVVIDFNFDLHDKSDIRILKDGTDYGTGPTTVDPNRLTLRRSMDPQAPDGLYTVMYNACWPDGSCHDGSFQFVIDRGLAAGFTDLRNQSAVTVTIDDLAFIPDEIIISPGTNVTWVNEDTVDHSVNTDSHPAHTYFPPQNSRVFSPGESHSVVFTTPGIYPYHCSVHPFMRGAILVG
jgi:plastocyanin/methionine-rich copper-binding protein CopC